MTTNQIKVKQTLVSARWVVPVIPRKEVLDHHSLLIEDDEIRAILPTEKARQQFPDATIIDRPHHVLIPGLINSHTHAAMCLFRGFADDLNLHQWLNYHIWPAESKWVDEEFIRDGTELAIAEMLSSGTTTFLDMYFYPDVVARCSQDLGMRACIGLMVMDFPTVWGENPAEYFAKGLEVHDEVRSLSLISTMLTPHAPYTVSDEPLLQTLTYADELQIPIHMHIHETEQEVKDALADSQQRPLARLDELGLLNPRLIAVHMTELSDEEITILANQGVHVVHCPNSNAKLASGQCRTADLIAAGVNVALGTDSAASNNNLDMFAEMRAAALNAKSQSLNAESVSAWQALEMATINGARAINLDEQIGSLEVGKAADLCAINLRDIATQPVYNPVSQLVYSASRHQVSDVWVAGKALVKNHQLQTIDSDKLLDKVSIWGARIASKGNQDV